ncbi:MAG TPA: beta-L-arabinofuranosidase domain-containing protein [Actinophytocola sp.]|uniref:glycoside hydrolase family 127 protein n=1 Tax=Actinophytocola sp. TaxID=1872138 RepID=UPI002DBC9496|nr:beta-L-arabinofuranosidase domain-containing protein [Actinophytocola sp.]HEU5475278.1 beta-L-arabinofuranosidase domain-containing protein [Actinophytocola sp.]
MTPEPGTTAPGGPAAPTAGAVAALRPLAGGAVRLDPVGLFGGWQGRNALNTLPHCIARIEDSGPMANMRRATGAGDGEHQGFWFSDSDIYKTAEAAAWELGRSGTPDLAGFLDLTATLLAKAQEADGYLNSYYQTDHPDRRWRELVSSHELYCAGHLIQAAVAAARSGVCPDLLVVARRFADLIVERFGPSGTDDVDGHPEIETALVELYRVTGHEPYLRVAERFVNLRGHGLLDRDRFGPQYYQDHQPVRESTEVTGHAVRQLYLLAGVVDVAVETGDQSLLDAAERLWDSAFRTKTYLTGAHGSRHRDEAFGDPYELPPDRAYAESCAAIASFHWNWRLLLATGRVRYADEMERVLHNAIAGAVAADGRHFFYSNPLQLRTGHDGEHEDAPSRRLPWYSCPCCPPNLARLMATLHCYLATADGDGVQLHLYGSADIEAPAGGLRVRTGYPWAGRVEIVPTRDADRPWTLALRIPSWCEEFTVTIDRQPVDAVPENGYVSVTRTWRAGTRILLDLRMPPRLVAAHSHVDAVRGCVALARGPLVYCVEQADLPDGVTLEDVRLDPSAPVRAVEQPGHPYVMVILAAAGAVVADPGALYTGYPPPADPTPRSVDLTAVPYFLWGNREAGGMRVWLPTV